MIIDPDKYDAVLVCGAYDCNAKKLYEDNLIGECVACHDPVQFRPHSPHGHNVATLCPECGLRSVMEMKDAGEEPECVITPQTSAEVFARTGRYIPPQGDV